MRGNRKRDRFTALLLALCLTLGSTFSAGLSAAPAYAADDTAKDITEAVGTFTDALMGMTSALYKPEDITKLGNVLNRFAGVTAAVSGGIAVLQIMGIMEDETDAKLDNILDQVVNIQETLTEMNGKLDAISEQLISQDARTEEIDRQNKADRMRKAWYDFEDSSLRPLKKMSSEYRQDKLDPAIKAWWNGSGRGEAVTVLYGTTSSGNTALTFSSGTVDILSSKEETSANGEVIIKDLSFGVPEGFITGLGTFNVNSYEKDFVDAVAPKIKVAADKAANGSASEGTRLTVNEGFIQAWLALDEDAKTKKSEEYARDLLNTEISIISSKAMSEDANHAWVTTVMDQYNTYCENIRRADSGVDALINRLYLTHSFEKETKKEITDVIDSMIVYTGTYGAFALSVAAQDNDRRDSEKVKIQRNMESTIRFLEAKKQYALTGNDDYCYLTGSVVGFTDMRVASEMTSKHKWTKGRYKQYAKQSVISNSAGPWKTQTTDGKDATLPAFMNDTWALVLYHYYQQQKKGDESFAGFLRKNGVDVPEDFDGDLMTKYGGASNFSLSDRLSMTANHLYGKEFTNGEFDINDQDASDIKDKYFTTHDKVTYNYLNTGTGEVKANQILVARAAYYEDHWYWYYDEGTVFTLNADVKKELKDTHIEGFVYNREDKLTISAPVTVLSLSKPGALKTQAAEDEEFDRDALDTMSAFDNISYMDVQEESREEPDYPDADWDADELDGIETYESDDEQIDEAIGYEIEAAAERAEAEGRNILLTESYKEKIAAEMRKMTMDLQQDLLSNDSLDYLDIFHIDGNAAEEKKLLDAMLPGLSDEYGISTANMITTVIYEAGATVRFIGAGRDPSYEVRPAYDIEPVLIIWDPSIDDYFFFYIDNEVIDELGLKMDLRIPATAVKTNSVTVRHYDDIYDLDLIEEFRLDTIGSGKDRYLQADVTSSGPFELTESEPGQAAAAPVTVFDCEKSRYEVTAGATATEPGTAALIKAKNSRHVKVPATVTVGGAVYRVTQVNAKAFTGSRIRTVTLGKNVEKLKAGAFRKSKVTKIIVKTKNLTSKGVRGSLKGSHVRIVKVKVGKASVNRKYVKKYRRIFTYKNCGKKVTVK